MDSDQEELFIGGISSETSDDKLNDTIDGKTVEAKRASSPEAYDHVTDVVQEPNLSLKFQSFDDAYEYYVNYGRSMGFNVRKKYSHKRASGEVCRKVYSCSKEGFKSENGKKKAYSRLATRIGCQAHILLTLDKNNDMVKVVSFKNEHNHDLDMTSMKHMVKANRRISGPQKAFAFNVERSGMSIKQTIDLMSAKVEGSQNLEFVQKDYENYIQNERRAPVKGDVNVMLKYFQKKRIRNFSFPHNLHEDDNNIVTSLFWADDRSIHDYHLFGDVVCFDTTYRTNKLDRPFALIVGVNHHNQNILFGAALLYEETTEVFKWLFESFLSAMSDKHPQTILTDQSAAMTKAIQEILPHTVHRLCVWHIYKNAAKHLSHAFKKRQFSQDFGNCIYNFEYEDDWLTAWEGMLDKYELRENKWLKYLFELKEKWATVYGRDTFTADMKNILRNQNFNGILKKYVKNNFDILQFLDNYDKVLTNQRLAELVEDNKMLCTSPILMTKSKMLLHASQVYTPRVFRIFQDEFLSVIECFINGVSEMEQSTMYKVEYDERESYVTYDSSTNDVYCSCKNFSFTGILCRHILKVLVEMRMVQIPTNYILKRWTKEARKNV